VCFLLAVVIVMVVSRSHALARPVQIMSFASVIVEKRIHP
jgi:hypothetical protein